jgi:hypothetical protein
MIKSNFREWTFDKIDDAFGTRQVFKNQSLNDWMAFEYECSEYEKRYLLQLQRTLLLGGDDWNEVELENKFISPIIVFTEIDNEKFSYFLERELTAIVGEYEISGRVDGMIATGFRNPRKPFFCLKEYKRQTDPDGNPQAQALIAMIAAQHLNNSDQILYGCYVVGKFWHFMVMEGKQYTISKSYKSDDEEIFDIYRILKGLKHNIELLSQ